MAEIVLVTGRPRLGKTAMVVDMLVNDPLYKGRKLYSNINGLKIDHNQPPDGHSWNDMHDWLKWPENTGAVVVFDEVQNLFPSRSNGAKMSDNVLFLNVHGHNAIDMIFMTQSTKIIDVNLRETVNKHYHIAKNKMGGKTLMEWNECANGMTKEARSALSRPYHVNEAILDLYKSAEAHTEPDIATSKWKYVLYISPFFVVATLGLVGFIGYKYYNQFKEKSQVTQAAGVTVPSASEVANNATESVARKADLVSNPDTSKRVRPGDFVAVLAENPQTKPIYDNIRQVRQVERVAGCIKTKLGCNCYSDQATKIREVTEELCNVYVRDGMPFDPFREKVQPSQQYQADSEHGNDPLINAQVVAAANTQPALTSPKLDN